MSEIKNELMEVENNNLDSFNNFLSGLQDEMCGLSLNFDRIKIPSGGLLAFQVPGDDPQRPDIVAELEGVIVDHYPINAYWKSKFTGQNGKPDCSSLDGIHGIGDPGGLCSGCPMNQYGENGKDCKNMHQIYLLRKGECLPVLLSLPPTSIKHLADYIGKRLLSKGLSYTDVVTRITLKQATSSKGITYSEAQFAVIERLNPEQKVKMAKYKSGIKPITRMADVIEGETKTQNEESVI